MAHYMPWFESAAVSGDWGWHWTMNHFDPDKVRWDGHREIAAHDSPVMGLYDSSDPDALECHALLMKFAGIDGVIVDWYGTEDFFDYAILQANTTALIPHLKRAGLKFSIYYEDQSICHMIEKGKINEVQGLALAQSEMAWLGEHWFRTRVISTSTNDLSFSPSACNTSSVTGTNYSTILSSRKYLAFPTLPKPPASMVFSAGLPSRRKKSSTPINGRNPSTNSKPKQKNAALRSSAPRFLDSMISTTRPMFAKATAASCPMMEQHFKKVWIGR